MTALKKMVQTMERLHLPVYTMVAPFRDTFPDEYLILTPVQSRPELWDGDGDREWGSQIRVSWYCRAGSTGHGKAMRQAGRSAGFSPGNNYSTYDAETGHHVEHQEFYIESEDDE